MTQKKSKSSRKSKSARSTVPQFNADADYLYTNTYHRQIHKVSRCPIVSAVVYKENAEVTRKLTGCTEKVGIQRIEMHGLPISVDSDSFQVQGKGKITILEVQYEEEDQLLPENEEEIETVEEKTAKEARQKIEESQKKIKEINRVIEKLQKKMNISIEQKDMIAKYMESWHKIPKDIRSDSRLNYSLEYVKEGRDFYLRRIKESTENINQLKQEINEQKKLIKEENGNIAEQNKIIARYNFKPKTSYMRVRKCIVELAASEPTDFELYISYLVSGASWSSNYVLRINSQDKQASLIYKADLINNTHEDWNEIDLTLSTAHPQKGGQPPLLPTFVLSIFVPPPPPQPVKSMYKEMSRKPVASRGMKRKKMAAPKMDRQSFAPPPALSSFSLQLEEESLAKYEESDLIIEDDEAFLSEESSDVSSFNDALEVPTASVTTTKVDTSGTTASYQISRKVSINSSPSPHSITVAYIELSIDMEYVLVPRVTSEAFLKAITTNKSDYTLLSGKMQVYVDNFLVSNSTLNNFKPGQKMDLYLGADSSVEVIPLPLEEDNSSSGILFKKSLNKKFNYPTKITNNKDEIINVKIYDTLPKTRDDKINIKLLEPTENYTLDKRNVVCYETKINPFETIKYNFIYQVDWPNSKLINVQPSQSYNV